MKVEKTSTARPMATRTCVRLLVPRTSDIRWIGNVSRTQYRSLLEAGVRVFEWNGSMIHAKTAIVDGRWARVGSTNLNLSSWAINRELDVSIEDSATVARLTAVFADDLQHATEVVLNQAQQAELKQRRQKHKQGFKRGSTNALAQRLLQLGHVFDGSIYGTRIVDKDEAQAYLSIGVGLLLLAAPWLLQYIDDFDFVPIRQMGAAQRLEVADSPQRILCTAGHVQPEFEDRAPQHMVLPG